MEPPPLPLPDASTIEFTHIFVPRIIGFTVMWFVLFSIYKAYVLPATFARIFDLTDKKADAVDSNGAQRNNDESTAVWYQSISRGTKSELCGRIVISIHHAFVATIGLVALVTDSKPLVHLAMYHEVACDITDIILITLGNGLTGLNWQGLMLHHSLSVCALVGAFVFGMNTRIAAIMAVILDGTGSTDYMFSTVIAKTPLMHDALVANIAVAQSVIFFLLRLIAFPIAGAVMAIDAYNNHSVIMAIITVIVVCGSMYFNLGMIRPRYAMFLPFYKDKQRLVDLAQRTPNSAQIELINGRDHQLA